MEIYLLNTVRYLNLFQRWSKVTILFTRVTQSNSYFIYLEDYDVQS